MNLSRKAMYFPLACLMASMLVVLSPHAAAAGPPGPGSNPCLPLTQIGNPFYTNSTSLSVFTSKVALGAYGEFVAGAPGYPLTALPYTPTTAILTAIDSPRVIASGSPCSNIVPFNGIIVRFSHKVSEILVFPALDHVSNHTGNGNGSFGWDAYQYAIWGLIIDPETHEVTGQDLLFDPIAVFQAE